MNINKLVAKKNKEYNSKITFYNLVLDDSFYIYTTGIFDSGNTGINNPNLSDTYIKLFYKSILPVIINKINKYYSKIFLYHYDPIGEELPDEIINNKNIFETKIIKEPFDLKTKINDNHIIFDFAHVFQYDLNHKVCFKTYENNDTLYNYKVIYFSYIAQDREYDDSNPENKSQMDILKKAIRDAFLNFEYLVINKEKVLTWIDILINNNFFKDLSKEKINLFKENPGNIIYQLINDYYDSLKTDFDNGFGNPTNSGDEREKKVIYNKYLIRMIKGNFDLFDLERRNEHFKANVKPITTEIINEIFSLLYEKNYNEILNDLKTKFNAGRFINDAIEYSNNLFNIK